MKKKHVVAFLATSFLVLAISIPALAQPTGPTADTLGVGNATGNSGTYVEVNVTVTNVKNGPIQGIRLSVDYNESVLSLTDIRQGDLTSNWTHLLGTDKHTMVIATADSRYVIQNGSSGSVVRLNFHVIGSSGRTSPLKISLVELSNPDGVVGTALLAPAKNGTFYVTSTTSTSTTTYSGGGGVGGYYVPPTTPTPKGAKVEEAEKVGASPSPPSSPSITPSAAPVQTPIPALATVPQTPPLFLLLIVIGVIVVAGILVMVLRRR